MTSERMSFKTAQRSIAGLMMLAALFGALSPACAQDASSSTADRARFVSITRELEKAPLDPSLKDDRTWALQWLTDAPDITVSVCPASLGGMVVNDYSHAPEILIPYVLAMAVGIIEHPEMAEDKVAQQIAGVESALAAYRAIIEQHPDAKWPALDGLLERQVRGELPIFASEAYESCMAKTR